jgi:hypothetical protein
VTDGDFKNYDHHQLSADFSVYGVCFQSVIDGDLCEMFNSLDNAKQRSVAEELERTPAEVSDCFAYEHLSLSGSVHLER